MSPASLSSAEGMSVTTFRSEAIEDTEEGPAEKC